MRQNARRRTANRARKSEIRTFTKRFMSAVSEGNIAAAEAEYRIAQQKVDKAAKRRTIHPNCAARKKSRMAALLNQLRAKQGVPAAPATPAEGS